MKKTLPTLYAGEGGCVPTILVHVSSLVSLSCSASSSSSSWSLSPFPLREQLLAAAVGGAVVVAMVIAISFPSPLLSPAVTVLVIGLRPLVPSLLVLVLACPVPWFCCHGSTSFSSQLLTAMGCRWPSLLVLHRPAPLSLLSAIIHCPDPLSTLRTGVHSGGVSVGVLAHCK